MFAYSSPDRNLTAPQVFIATYGSPLRGRSSRVWGWVRMKPKMHHQVQPPEIAAPRSAHVPFVQGDVQEEIQPCFRSANGACGCHCASLRAGAGQHRRVAAGGRKTQGTAQPAHSDHQPALFAALSGRNRRLYRAVVGNWDTATFVDRLELQVGKDLQYIRINGTLVGGLVGLADFRRIEMDRDVLGSVEIHREFITAAARRIFAAKL